MIRAIWEGAVLAESDSTQIVEGKHYFPPDSIHKQFFRDSNTETECSWKGTAKYYDVQVDSARNPDAAWYYPTPKDAAANIKGYVAFWKGVRVEE